MRYAMPNNFTTFKGFIIRDYQEGDEEKICKLMFQNFPISRSLNEIKKLWHWEFKESPVKKIAILIAEKESVMASQYALIPLNMNFLGNKILGALSLNTVTDKKFRGLGLFPYLATSLYNKLSKEGIKFIYGFPNAMSIKGFIKRLSWIEISKFPVIIKPINIIPYITRIAQYLPIFMVKFCSFILCTPFNISSWLTNLLIRKSAIRLEEVEHFDSKVDKLWETTQIKKQIAVIRDSEFLNWRYLIKPYHNYKAYIALESDIVVGFVIFYIEERFGLRMMYIMELIVKEDNRSIYQTLLNATLKQARKKKIHLISILSLESNPHHSLLRKNGYVSLPRKLLPQKLYFGARINNSDIDHNILYDKKNWYVSWGDIDVV